MFKKLSLIAVMIAFLSNVVYAESDMTSPSATSTKTVNKTAVAKHKKVVKKNANKTTKIAKKTTKKTTKKPAAV